jgi:hypothetical protein
MGARFNGRWRQRKATSTAENSVQVLKSWGHQVMQVRWSTGLWRLWVVGSLIWAILFAVIYGMAYTALPPKVTPSVGFFDDLIPKYKPCWDYRTPDGKNIDIRTLSDEALIRVYDCQLSVDRSALLMTATATVIGGPLVALIFGWSLLWIGRGFQRSHEVQ